MSSSLQGQIAEANGSNCTKVQTPCPYTKVGVLRMRRDARNRAGHRIPLYVNLFVVSNPKRARRHSGDRLAILPHPKLKVTRYQAFAARLIDLRIARGAAAEQPKMILEARPPGETHEHGLVVRVTAAVPASPHIW